MGRRDTAAETAFEDDGTSAIRFSLLPRAKGVGVINPIVGPAIPNPLAPSQIQSRAYSY